MLQAYVDDSKSEQDPPFYVLGGYLGPAEMWARFSNEWRRSLDMRPPTKYFKYREALRGEGEFNGASEELRFHRIRTMRQLIEHFDLVEFGIGFCISDHNDAFKLVSPDRPNPYVFAASRIISLIVAASQIHGLPPFLEAWEGATRLARDLPNQTPLVANLFRSAPSWADDEDVLPLQAADMHATWLRIDAENQLQGRERVPVDGFSKELRGVSKVYSRGELHAEFWQTKQDIVRFQLEGKR